MVFSYLRQPGVRLAKQEHILELTYIVNTIPPLSINLAKRGTAPDQKVKSPSSRNILAAQLKLFLYSLRASIDCILNPMSSGRNLRTQSQLTVSLPCPVVGSHIFPVFRGTHLSRSSLATYPVIRPGSPAIPKVLTVPGFSHGAI